MKEVFELKPIIIAALIGGLFVMFVNNFDEQSSPSVAFGVGALIGSVVQVGVRITGVS
jgi:hypothetical protein